MTQQIVESEKIERWLFQVLRSVKNVPDPSKAITVAIRTVKKGNPGEVMLVDGYPLEEEGSGTSAFEQQLQNHFGITVHNEVPLGYKNVVKATSVAKESPTYRFWYVAPWFMQWYCASSLIDPEIRELVHRLCRVWIQGWNRMVYRGEVKEFPSVRSTISRKWNTTSVEMIQSLEKHNNSNAALTVGQEFKNFEAAVQHVGGVSNLIDFTSNIWTAAYFACREESDDTGRIWGFDTQRTRQGIETVESKESGDELANQRMKCQQSVFVKSETGVLETPELELICKVEGKLKRKVLDFLNGIGIKERVLFPDLIGVINNDQEEMSAEALMHKIREWIEIGEIKQAYSVTNHFVNADRDGADPKTTGLLYYRGIANALLNRPQRGCKDLVQAQTMISKPVPKMVKKNVALVCSAAKSGDCSKLKSKLDLTVLKQFWSITLTGDYRFVEDI